MAEPKEWFSAKIRPNGSTVTCSVQDGAVSARATVKTFSSPKYIKESAQEARKQARATLAALKEVFSDGADG